MPCTIPFARTAVAVSLALALASCATHRPYAVPDATLKKPPETLADDKGVGTGQSSPSERLQTYHGTGVLVRGQLPGGELPPSSITPLMVPVPP